MVALLARGSYGSSESQPFMSDLDLAVVIESGTAAEELAVCQRALEIYDRLRKFSPILKDPWLTILTRAEWESGDPALRYLDARKWKLLRGDLPFDQLPIPSAQELGLRNYSVADIWIRRAIKDLYYPGVSSVSFHSALKKILKVLGHASEFEEHLKKNPFESLATVLTYLEVAARAVLDNLDSDFAEVRKAADSECQDDVKPLMKILPKNLEILLEGPRLSLVQRDNAWTALALQKLQSHPNRKWEMFYTTTTLKLKFSKALVVVSRNESPPLLGLALDSPHQKIENQIWMVNLRVWLSRNRLRNLALQSFRDRLEGDSSVIESADSAGLYDLARSLREANES
jgi:hypothetical protein